jgi:hypothetical protein
VETVVVVLATVVLAGKVLVAESIAVVCNMAMAAAPHVDKAAAAACLAVAARVVVDAADNCLSTFGEMK